LGGDVSACLLEVPCALEFFLHFLLAMLSSLLGLFLSCLWVCSFSERSHEAKELFGFRSLGYDKRGVSWVRLDQTSRKKNCIGDTCGRLHWILRALAFCFDESISDGLFV
jgi:hypothetical protein